MIKKKIVKMKVHAGGGWLGHVVFTTINPESPDDHNLSSNIEEALSFCEKRGLSMDEDFKRLVLAHLVYQSKYGFVVPPHIIDEDRPISSCSSYLKSHFSEYY
jgi:hypothetical protein